MSVRLDESRPWPRSGLADDVRGALADDVRGALDALRRWVGEPVPEQPTGERVIPRQRVPA